MNIALICVVNPQDNDVFPDMLLYYYNLGIKHFYLMLHKSDPVLRNHVFLFETMYDVSVKTFFNDNDEHYHEQDCKVLTDAAIADGMNWIIGSDADELLVLKQHENIEDFLKQFDSSDNIILSYKWIDYRSDADVSENAFINMKYRCKDFMDVTDKGWVKTNGKFSPTMIYSTGFHSIIGSENIVEVSPEQAFYAHFPERNFEQYEKKTNLQRKNWINRYGFFYIDKQIADNPNYLKEAWKDKLITSDGLRTVCNNDKSLQTSEKMEYVYDPINLELFRL